MKYNPDIHHRRSIRLKDYDYSQTGAYFVTICIQDRECLLGEIEAGKMRLNKYGSAAIGCWYNLPDHYAHVELDEFVIMPNHVHGIIVISDVVGAGFKPALSSERPYRRAGLKPAPTSKQHGLPEIIRAFKTFSSKEINLIRKKKQRGQADFQRAGKKMIKEEEMKLDQIGFRLEMNLEIIGKYAVVGGKEVAIAEGMKS